MKFKFLYHDKPASKQTVESYIVGTQLHENDYVVASTLRGNLLTGCNLRYLFFAMFKGEEILVHFDYKRQGLYIFEPMLYYKIYDNYRVGDFNQVLLSPVNDIPDDFVEDMILAARKDFNELLTSRTVPVLDTPDWHSRLGNVPIGKHGKQPDHRQIIL